MKFIKKNLYAFFASFILLLSIAFGIFIYTTYGHGDDIDTTSVGYLSVDTSDTVINQQNSLIANINSWKTRVNYEIKFQGEICTVDIDLFDFDAPLTVGLLKKNESNLAYYTVNESKKEELIDTLTETYGSKIVDITNVDGTNGLISNLMTQAQNLATFYTVDLYEFVYQNGNNVVELSQGFLTGISEVNIDNILSILSNNTDDEVVVSASFTIPSGRFSMLEYFKNYDLTNVQLSIIATGLADLILKSSFVSIEVVKSQLDPFCSSTAVPFMVIKPNNIYDVESYDLTFYNPETYDFEVLLTKSSDDTISFSLRGVPYAKEYTSQPSTTIVPYSTTRIASTDFLENYSKNDPRYTVTFDETRGLYLVEFVSTVGVNGSMVYYNRLITDVDGRETTIQLYNIKNDYIQEIIYYAYVSEDLSQLG